MPVQITNMSLQEALTRLTELKEQFPDLTFDNNGYQYLSPAIKERHKEQIEEISSIMKEQFPHFVRFDNFKPRKDGTFAIRCQTHWDSSFVGVEYFDRCYFEPRLESVEMELALHH